MQAKEKSKPKAPETPDSKKKLGEAESRHNKAKENICRNTQAQCNDLTRDIFDIKKIKLERANLQARYNDGAGDMSEDQFNKAMQRLDKREALAQKSNGVISEKVTTAFQGVDFTMSETKVATNTMPSKWDKQINLWHPDAVSELRGMHDDIMGLANMDIHALLGKENTMDTNADKITVSIDPNAALSRARNIALNTQWSSGIDAKPMSRPQNIKAPEMPQIKVQKIPA